MPLCYLSVDEVIIMTFGQRLKALRTELSLTQEELAKRCGISKQNISRYENSDREPNIRTAKMLADALGVELAALAHDEQDSTPPEDLDDSPQVRMIARAGKKMSEADREKMLQLLKVAFPDKFDD